MCGGIPFSVGEKRQIPKYMPPAAENKRYIDMTDNNIERIVNYITALQYNGVSVEEIAYKFGVSKQTIYNYKCGRVPRTKQQRFIDFVKDNYGEVYINEPYRDLEE